MASRFIYRANAVAAGGRLLQPAPATIPLQAAVVLPVAGGSGTAESVDFRLGDLLTFRRSTSFVAAGSLPEDRGWGTASETIVEGISILGGRLTVDRLVARLTSHHPPEPDGPREPHITIEGTRLEGLRIDGRPVAFDSHAQLFSSLSTFTSVQQAFTGNRGGFRDIALKQFLWGGGVPADAPAALRDVLTVCQEQTKGRNPSAPVLRGLIPCSVVGNIRPPRGLRLCVWGSWIGIPGLGRVQLGELLIGTDSRRLTMLRVELDTAYEPPARRGAKASGPVARRALRAGEGDEEQPTTGELSLGGIETNGSPIP